MSTSSLGIESLWQQSDFVIKTVAIILLVMSILTWIIIVVRAIQMSKLARLSKMTPLFWQQKNYADGIKQLQSHGDDNPFHHIANNAKESIEHHLKHKAHIPDILPINDWLNNQLENIIDEYSDKLQFGLGVLASVGSTSPFIGLFGTVWGIYHALIGISLAGHVNISEVAGPIGEALIMTAFGLVVAIPAVLGFNGINRSNRKISKKLYRFASQIHDYFLTGAMPTNSQFSAKEKAE